jgi:hypothetical protein
MFVCGHKCYSYGWNDWKFCLIVASGNPARVVIAGIELAQKIRSNNLIYEGWAGHRLAPPNSGRMYWLRESQTRVNGNVLPSSFLPSPVCTRTAHFIQVLFIWENWRKL